MVMEALAEENNLALLAMGRSESLGCFCPVNDILRDAIKILSRSSTPLSSTARPGLNRSTGR